MPAYANIQNFMQRARAVNSHFEWVKTSSLRPLINVLNDVNGSLQQVRNALTALLPAKSVKYKTALYYLLGTYPGLSAYPNSINFGPLGKLNAAQFPITNLPNPYDPSYPTLDRIVPASNFLNMTVEGYIISNPATGVILIHLSSHDNGMNEIFNGEKCIDHVKSVLRVASDNNCDLCILYMTNPPVLPALQPEVNAFNNPTLVLEPQVHMGTAKQQFLTFAQNHNHVVVMGFDGTVCVPANLFGVADRDFNHGWARPLTTVSNVVTSRAVVVSTGTIYSKGAHQYWGSLNNT